MSDGWYLRNSLVASLQLNDVRMYRKVCAVGFVQRGVKVCVKCQRRYSNVRTLLIGPAYIA